MKKVISLLTLLLCTSLFIKAEDTPAFPGAEGFGRYTTGGRGGKVVHVTSVEDDGSEGTLRWALSQTGRKTIVFDVSGTIHLTSALSVSIGNCTIAGQTAPGDGICVADYPFTIDASNVIVRFMRFRLGNKYVDYHEGDGLGGCDQSNIIVDHCSVSWSIDECLSIYGNVNSTVQWCIVSQALCNSGHSKGSHGYGGNWGGSGATFHHNLMAHNNSRTPRFGPRQATQEDERMDYRNNVIYNWAGNGCYGGEGMDVNVVNNYYKPGPGTKTRSTTIQRRIASTGCRTTAYCTNSDGSYNGWYAMWHHWGQLYVDGNVNPDYDDVTSDNWTYGIYNQISSSSDNDYTYTQTTKDTMKLDAPIDYIWVTTHTAEVAYAKVLAYSGACLSRDAVDELIIYDTENGVASYSGSNGTDVPGMIDSQDDIRPADADDDWSAWPTLTSNPAPVDTDGDGMPDDWETANGLDPNDESDRNNVNDEGYTMLEVYINSLVADIMDACTSDGEQSGTTITTEDEVDEDGTIKTDIVIDNTTYQGSETTGEWTFENDVVVSNVKSKAYSKGSNDMVKYSSGVTFTVSLPDAFTMKAITLEGYDNYDEADSYLSKLAGTTYSSTDYVFPSDKSVVTHQIIFDAPVEDSFTFEMGSKQTVLRITLHNYVPTTDEVQDEVQEAEGEADSAVCAVAIGAKNTIDVYDLMGRCVAKDAEQNELKNLLPRGIYVAQGKKIVVK